jgi:hypothetical protein
VQEGNSCYFIEKKDNKNFASWEQKDKLVTGYFIDKESKICRLKDFSKSSRSEEDKNVFNSFEEASGSEHHLGYQSLLTSAICCDSIESPNDPLASSKLLNTFLSPLLLPAGISR